MIGNSYLETETNKKLETAVKDSINIIKNEKIVNIQDNQSIAYGANNRPLDNK